MNNDYEINMFYELSCPNPECSLKIRVKGDNVIELSERLRERGCPLCKFQFINNEYHFKIGEKKHDLPINQTRIGGFYIKEIKISK